MGKRFVLGLARAYAIILVAYKSTYECTVRDKNSIRAIENKYRRYYMTVLYIIQICHQCERGQ